MLHNHRGEASSSVEQFEVSSWSWSAWSILQLHATYAHCILLYKLSTSCGRVGVWVEAV